jgi:hypothetical protein
MDWTAILASVMETLIPLVILALGALLVAYLKKRGVKDETMDLISEAYDLLTKCVLKINQTMVDTLKANKEFGPDQQALVKQACIEEFEKLANDSIKLAIETVYGSLSAWLDTMIEATVQEVKISRTAV